MEGLKKGDRILVIGASGGIGLDVVKQALEAGYRVRALSRHADAIAIESDRLEKVSADATDGVAVADALEGTAAAVIALGVPLTPSAMLFDTHLFSRATQTLVHAMQEAGVRRVVAVTGFGSGDSRACISRAEALPFSAVFGRVYADKSRQEEVLRGSGLDWTIVRPTILTRGRRSRRYQVLVGRDAWRNGVVSRADVADFILSVLGEGSFLREAPVLAR